MPRSSSKREEVYEFLAEFISENNYAPSVREICAATGLSSTASAYYHLKALAQEGKIVLDESKKRAITLLSAPHAGKIPIVGTVQAGAPILAVENIDGYLPWDGEDGCFALRVRGDSMINAGILPGDKLIVRPQQNADNGDIVVALLDDEATVKRLQRKDGHVWLLPENDAFSPISGDNATLIGKVKGVVREY